MEEVHNIDNKVEKPKASTETFEKTLQLGLAEERIEQGKGEVEKLLTKVRETFEEIEMASVDKPKDKKRIIILDCSGGFELGHLTFLASENFTPSNADVVDVVKENDKLPVSLDEVAGIVITGAPANIEDKLKSGYEWIGNTEEFVKKALSAGIPTMGICFGIQMHADIQGREVPKNEGGREMGVWKTAIYRDEKMPQHPIFKGMDFQKDPKSDKESVLIETVGSHAFRAGYDKKQRTELYGLHYTDEGNAYPMIEISDGGKFVGTQFHPELSSKYGFDLIQALVKVRYNLLKDAGKDPEKILEELADYRKRVESGETNTNKLFLDNFVKWALEK